MKHENLIETVCSIGDALLETIPSNDPAYKLINAIHEARPTKDHPFNPSVEYLASELELLENDLTGLFEKADKRIKSLFVKEGKVQIDSSPFIDVPVIGSAFVFQIEDSKHIVIKTKQQFSFEVGEEVFPYYFRELLGDKFYQIDYKMIEMDFDGIVTVYFLKKVSN